MASKRTASNRKGSDAVDPRKDQPIDIDDAAIDETARVVPDEELAELANPDVDREDLENQSEPKGTWRERDANRRAHGPDDLKG